ncbi:MAG: glycosyltransferase family 4 protein [Bacteroidales bacterium]|nr:glycosyltransferase family 4 protein [Bacteroidales bacterium]
MIVFSHAGGNQNSRSAVNGICKAGMLHSFHISIAMFKSSWYYKFLFGPLHDFRKRTFDDILKNYTIVHPVVGLLRVILPKIKLGFLCKHETGIFCGYKECCYIDKKTAKHLSTHYKDVNAVYCCEDIANETFKEAKKHGVKCLFEEPIGYWREMRRMLGEEVEKHPDWAVTMVGFEDSCAKLKRKDEELAMADLIFVASSFTKKTLDSYPGQLSNIEVIPYGFPPVNNERIYLPLEKRKLKLLYVGGLTQRKGIAYVFDSIKGLEDKVELTVIGSGKIDECSLLKEELSKVNYLGTKSHDEVLSIMAQSDILLFPSLFEGFGLVVSEAMSQGTPAIVTDRTCGPDIITNEVDGWIVEAGSSAPIKRIIESVLRNPSCLKSLGESARVTAAKRPWDKYEEELTTSIKTFLSANKSF